MGRRLWHRPRRGAGADQRAQRARQPGDGHLRRRTHGRGDRGRARHRRRSRRHRDRHRPGSRAAVGHRGPRHRDGRLRPGQPGRTRPAGDVRLRLRHRPVLPRTSRCAHHRQPGAYCPAAARLLGRSRRGRRRATARDQHEPPRRRLLPRHPGRRRAARPDRRARARGNRPAAAARRHDHPRPPGPADEARRRPSRGRGPAHPRGRGVRPGGSGGPGPRRPDRGGRGPAGPRHRRPVRRAPVRGTRRNHRADRAARHRRTQRRGDARPARRGRRCQSRRRGSRPAPGPAGPAWPAGCPRGCLDRGLADEQGSRGPTAAPTTSGSGARRPPRTRRLSR